MADIFYDDLFLALEKRSMNNWANSLKKQLNKYFSSINHGDYDKWSCAIDRLPNINPSLYKLDVDTIIVGKDSDATNLEKKILKEQLDVLIPWRKGPFNIFGINIDAEWRSDLKWQRLKDHISPLTGRYILDIGCGNGYYAWRMLGENASHVVGFEPNLLFLMQFNVLKKYIPENRFNILPFGTQFLPKFSLNFDSVFSMGVIYHRREPLVHLQKIFNCLVSQGELILETLIIDSNKLETLTPIGRYAKMKNVWHIPSKAKLIKWVRVVGFTNVRIINISKTTPEEQRTTDWMTFESLTNFLDVNDSSKTVEGYPSPTRAILLANKP